MSELTVTGKAAAAAGYPCGTVTPTALGAPAVSAVLAGPPAPPPRSRGAHRRRPGAASGRPERMPLPSVTPPAAGRTIPPAAQPAGTAVQKGNHHRVAGPEAFR